MVHLNRCRWSCVCCSVDKDVFPVSWSSFQENKAQMAYNQPVSSGRICIHPESWGELRFCFICLHCHCVSDAVFLFWARKCCKAVVDIWLCHWWKNVWSLLLALPFRGGLALRYRRWSHQWSYLTLSWVSWSSEMGDAFATSHVYHLRIRPSHPG